MIRTISSFSLLTFAAIRLLMIFGVTSSPIRFLTA